VGGTLPSTQRKLNQSPKVPTRKGHQGQAIMKP